VRIPVRRDTFAQLPLRQENLRQETPLERFPARIVQSDSAVNLEPQEGSVVMRLC